MEPPKPSPSSPSLPSPPLPSDPHEPDVDVRPPTRPTLELDHRGPITYESALNKDGNIINRAGYHVAARELSGRFWDNRATIEGLVRHHLGLGSGTGGSVVVVVEQPSQWIRGSFNVCIPVEVRHAHPSTTHPAPVPTKFVVRCAMPHKLAEARYPGTVDEKLGCEVGTYAWMQAQCPDVRILHLYGFGFSDHSNVGQLTASLRCSPVDEGLAHMW